MKTFFDNLGEILLTALALTALRIAALYPALAALLGGRTGFSVAVRAAAGLLFYLFAVIPARNFGYMRLRSFSSASSAGKAGYGRLLSSGAARLGRGLPWCVPAFFLMGLWYYGFSVMDLINCRAARYDPHFGIDRRGRLVAGYGIGFQGHEPERYPEGA